MRKISIVLAMIGLIAGSAAASGDSLTIDMEIDSEKYRFHDKSNTVEFLSVMSGEEAVKYSNTSYREFATWQIEDEAVERVREAIESSLGGLKGLKVGSSGEEITVTYLVNRSFEREFNFSKLKTETPPVVDASASIGDETVEIKIPVNVEKKSYSPDKIAYELKDTNRDTTAYSRKNQSVTSGRESLSVKTGNGWKSTVLIEKIISNRSREDRITGVQFENNNLTFTGFMPADTPCQRIQHDTFRESGDTYVMDLETVESNTSRMCIQRAVVFNYTANFEADKPFKLQVRHGGEPVKTLAHPSHSREVQKSSLSVENQGHFEKFIDWVKGFFRNQEVTKIEADSMDVETVKKEDGKGKFRIEK